MAFDRIRLPFVTSAVLLTASGGGPGGDAIDRDTFVATYVDLRVAALETDSTRLAATDREEILARHGVTGDDLTHFAEVHAAELEFMREVWNEIELALDREPDSN